MRKNTINDFWRHVKKTKTCWLWKASGDGQGYGLFCLAGKRYKTHRFSYYHFKEKFDYSNKKILVCHKCDNPPCVNPDHLFLGTHKDNFEDGIRKKRIGSFNKPKTLCMSKRHKLSETGKLRKDGSRYCYACFVEKRRKYQRDNKKRINAWARAYYHRQKKK